MLKSRFAFLRTSIVIFAFFAVLMTVFGILIYSSTGKTMQRQMGNQCLGIATAVSVIIEQDVAGYLDFIRTLDTDGAYYRALKGRLEEIRYGNEGNIRFLYTEIRISDTEMMYVLDGERAGSEGYSPPGDTDALTVTRKRAYDTQSAYVGETFTENSYGRLLSAYAPIRDGAGNFIGLVGVDVSADQYDEIMRYQLYVIIGSIVTLTLMTAMLSLLLFRAYNDKLRSDRENTSKSNFLARMSHEIRTPMNAIMGMSELMMRETLPPTAREQTINIHQSAENLLAIINDILDFSKIESNRMDIVKEPYLFASMIHDVISIIRVRLADKPVLFAVNIDCRIPLGLIGDEVRLRQILLNVLSNAVKYTGEGFVTLAVDGRFAGEDTVMLSIEVADSGMGIREEDQGRLFQDFIQVDSQSHRHIEGTGLGLAITRRLCLAMGGDIRVSSRYGKGSTFTITLPQQYKEYIPFAAVENPETKAVLVCEPRKIYADSIFKTVSSLGVRCTLAAPHSAFLKELRESAYSHVLTSSFLYDSVKRIVERLGLNVAVIMLKEYGESAADFGARSIALPAHAISIANSLNGVDDHAGYYEYKARDIRFTAPGARVLIVDDIGTNLSVAEGLITPFQMLVDCAKSGREAIDLVQANRYDLVLMDHMMPEMSGIEATEKIRALEGRDEYYARLPIVAMTANAVSGMRDMYLQNGMNDFIAKPIEIAKLYSVLEKWIPKGKQIQSAEGGVPRAAPPSVEIGGIDTKTGIYMTGGDTDNYLRILGVFHKDSVEKIRQIRDCLAADDIALFTTHVHALKSAAASVGASEISELAKKLEMAGIRGDRDFIAGNIDALVRGLDSIFKNIAAYFAPRQDERESGTADDARALVAHLAALKSALSSIDVEAADRALDNLRAARWSPDVQEKLNGIYQCILLFEYEQAARVIDELCSGAAL